MSLSGTFRISSTITNDKDNIDLSNPTETCSLGLTKEISTSGRYGKLYHAQLTLLISETREIDVGDGSLLDVYGDAIPLINIDGFYIETDSTNTTTVTVTTGANSIFATQPPLSAGEGQAFLTEIDTTTNSKIYLVAGAVAGQKVKITFTGDISSSSSSSTSSVSSSSLSSTSSVSSSSVSSTSSVSSVSSSSSLSSVSSSSSSTVV